MRIQRIAMLCLLAAGLPGSTAARAAAGPPEAEIRWDKWGVPHVFADDDQALFHAFGWAQMHSHRNLVLRLYGRARGRAAEYWGRDQLASDALVHALDIPRAAERGYAAQSPKFRRLVDRFVEGLNAYAAAHPDQIAPENRAVLPVVGADLFGHLQMLIEFGFIGRGVLRGQEVSIPVGSNALALAPARTAGRNAMLMVNPHLPWSGFYTFYEAHFKTRGRDLYGVALVGLPVLTMAFNESLGWAHTANNVDGADVYEVEAVDGGRYRFDGRTLPFGRQSRVLQARDEQGELRPATVTVTSTLHGPVLFRRGDKAYAYRSTRALYPGLFEQYWEMARARDLGQFRRALKKMQLPLFNVIYADRDGHIMFMWNGLLPERGVGDFPYWAGTVPGGDARTLWTKTFPYKRLPQLVDPPSGWVQNTNDAPWTSTLPVALQSRSYPAFVAPERRPELRSQQLLRVLSEAPPFTFEALRELKFSSRVELAERLLDDLLGALDALPADAPRRELLLECRRVLRAWDRRVDADSRGAVLFLSWVVRLSDDPFAQGWSAQQPLLTPRGLKEPQAALASLVTAAEQVAKRYGSIDVKWGDAYRLKRGAIEVPASGAPDFVGSLTTVEFGEGPDGKFYGRGGESYSAIVEFARPLRAEVLLGYGNSSEESSPHNGDQLALLAQKKMRKALLDAAEIDAQLARSERLSLAR